jgi:pantothenate kinase
VQLEDLVARAGALVGPRRRAILGITGPPGAGKSTLAERLTAALLTEGVPARLLPMDGFHLPDVALERLGRRDRKGAVDTFDAFGYLALLERARVDSNHTVYAPSFHRDLEQPLAGAIPIEPADRLLVTEGNYLLLGARPWTRIRDLLAEVWYCALDDDLRRQRLIARHVEFGKAPDVAAEWVDTVDERNARLVAATRGRADLVVDMATT